MEMISTTTTTTAAIVAITSTPSTMTRYYGTIMLATFHRNFFTSSSKHIHTVTQVVGIALASL